MKSILENLQREFFKTGAISKDSYKDLEKYVDNNKNDVEFYQVIELIIGTQLYDIIPKIIFLLEHKEEDVRTELIVGLIGKLTLVEYAEIALKMYKEDKSLQVKVMILYNIGYVINKIEDKELRKEIAEEVIKGLDKDDEGYSYRNAAYHSIVNALDVDIKNQPDFTKDLQNSDLDINIINRFKDLYIKKVKTIENFLK